MIRPEGMGAQLWFHIWIGGSKWGVYLATSECPYLDDREGVTLHGISSILLDRTYEYTRMICTLGHELTHAAMGNHNEELSSAVLSCEESSATKSEERSAAFFGAHIFGSLNQAGLLKLPPLPEAA